MEQHTTGEVRWAAMRAIMAELIECDTRGSIDFDDDEIRDLVAGLRQGADVRTLSASIGKPRDSIVAILVRIARG